MIPVYQVKVPDYKLKKFKKAGKTADYAVTPWFNIRIPKVYEDNKPDFKKIGKKIDTCLKKHFLGKKVAVRVIGSQEHKGKSVGNLIKIIKKLGHDRYDPKRAGDRYENIDGKHIDFFALDFKVNAKGEYFKDFLEPFYYWPITDRQEPIRIDIAIIYDLIKLKRVIHRYKGREKEIKKDGFVFKHHDKKPDAVMGVIRIN